MEIKELTSCNFSIIESYLHNNCIELLVPFYHINIADESNIVKRINFFFTIQRIIFLDIRCIFIFKLLIKIDINYGKSYNYNQY